MIQTKAKFKKLYNQHYKAIYNFCFRMLGNHENARDITQETFIKLLNRKNKPAANIENTKAWLYKVAGNLCLNLLNTNTRRHEIENRLEKQSIENTNPENILINNEKTLMVRKAIAGLKPEKQLLILMYQDGLSYKQISEATGINFKSVGKTLWRIINKLSENINNESNE